jgi:C-methyltransferase C-terminal domain
VLYSEIRNGILELDSYLFFKTKVEKIKIELIEFLISNKKDGNKICGYEAAAKGMTLLNYAHIGPDLIDCIYDSAPLKQGKYTPGMHIPIKNPNEINNDCPDIVIIFPWNILTEVLTVLSKLTKKDLKIVQVKGCLEVEFIKSMVD